MQDEVKYPHDAFPHVSQRLLFVNVVTLSCLGSLWFATHPYYSLNQYVNLYYLWSIFIAKDRRYP